MKLATRRTALLGALCLVILFCIYAFTIRDTQTTKPQLTDQPGINSPEDLQNTIDALETMQFDTLDTNELDKIIPELL